MVTFPPFPLLSIQSLNIYFLSYSEFYPEGDPSKPGVYSRLVSQRATARIGDLLERTQGKIVFGGIVDKENRYIAPTVVRDVPVNDSLMSE